MAERRRPDRSKPPRFACLLLRLDPEDPGYAEGYRYRVDQNDPEDQHFFKARTRADEFIDLHSFYVVGVDEMNRLREKTL